MADRQSESGTERSRRAAAPGNVFQIEVNPDGLQNGGGDAWKVSGDLFGQSKDVRQTNGGTFIDEGNRLKPNTYVPEELDEEVTGVLRYVEVVQKGIGGFFESNAAVFRIGLYLLLLLGYHVFLGFALSHNFKKAEPLMILTIVVWAYVFYRFVILRFCSPFFRRGGGKVVGAYMSYAWRLTIFRLACYLLVLAAVVVFLVFDTANDRTRLIGLSGMAFYVLLMFLCSAHPSHINWRPVILGLLLQFIMGLLVLRWDWGGQRFNDATTLVIDFLSFTDNGTSFVYGFLAAPPNICGMSPVFAFSVIQAVVYFGAVVALLYYFGIMQAVLRRMGWLMQLTLGTTATESLNSCACIFLGQSESPMLIRPYLGRMTASELHAVMTSGFSCIAGSLFAAYIAMGACPTYLLSATVMSAPGSLACSKILYPETEKSQLKNIEDLELPKGEENNALECISNGAVAAVELVTAILANLIVFLALLAFIDSVIGYMGGLVGQEGWSFELFLGYVFFPLAYVMGVTGDINETLRVAQLMGTKTVLNEFIAYQHLGEMIDNNLLSASAMVATYALAGFSNFSSVGIQLGVLGGMQPERKPLLSRLALRALFAGCISCFMTASLAGVLISNPINCPRHLGSSDCFNITEYVNLRHNSTDGSLLESLSLWTGGNSTAGRWEL
ncbi:Sodium/nucleoside cotransporter [Aphelenchoides fujianensis]|nr:Sodium/nucleoside cotransporter [Aphelenchoides fujianensis]